MWSSHWPHSLGLGLTNVLQSVIVSAATAGVPCTVRSTGYSTHASVTVRSGLQKNNNAKNMLNPVKHLSIDYIMHSL